MTDFLLWPDKRLRTAVDPVETIDKDVVAIWKRLYSSVSCTKSCARRYRVC